MNTDTPTPSPEDDELPGDLTPDDPYGLIAELPISQRRNPVDVVIDGTVIRPPIMLENFEFPGIPGGWARQVKVAIFEEPGKGDQIAYYDMTKSPPMLLGLSQHVRRVCLVQKDDEVYFISHVKLVNQASPDPAPDGPFGGMTAAAMKELNLTAPQAQPVVEGVFVIRRKDGIHSAFRGQSIVRERIEPESYRRLFDWLSRYYSL